MNNLFALEGKVAVITGGSGYLGRAVVKGLLDAGGSVAVADIREPSDELWEGAAAASERLDYVHCDVADSASVRNAFRHVQSRFGRIDILINNAMYGAGYGPAGTVEAMSDEDWQRGLDGAAGVCFRCTREIIPGFKAGGGGIIVNMASMYGLVSPDPSIYGTSGSNNPVNYGAGKAAVIQLTRYCAAHLAPYGIRVNSVSPGPFPDPAKQTNAAFLNELRKKTMLGRIGKAEDIVGAVLFLSSAASDFVTGSNVVVDGGWTAW